MYVLCSLLYIRRAKDVLLYSVIIFYFIATSTYLFLVAVKSKIIAVDSQTECCWETSTNQHSFNQAYNIYISTYTFVQLCELYEVWKMKRTQFKTRLLFSFLSWIR
jgi:hypothetical protein